MPWMPELFTAPAAAHIADKARRERLAAIPYFEGLTSGDTAALVGSFAGEPELHHPTRGRVRGARAFERFADVQRGWLITRNAETQHVGFVVTPNRSVEELILHLDANDERVALPVPIATDRTGDAHLVELRMYFSTWPLTGRHAVRPPLLQLEPGLEAAGVIGEYQRALAAGDVEAAVACLEPDDSFREPAGSVHRGVAECATSTSSSSPTAVASRWNTAPRPMTGARARSSTTSSRGDAPRCHRRLVLPSTCEETAESWRQPGSTTASRRPPWWRVDPQPQHQPSSSRLSPRTRAST